MCFIYSVPSKDFEFGPIPQILIKLLGKSLSNSLPETKIWLSKQGASFLHIFKKYVGPIKCWVNFATYGFKGTISDRHFFPNPQIFLHIQGELHCINLPIQ